jgi:hypothetical protein
MKKQSNFKLMRYSSVVRTEQATNNVKSKGTPSKPPLPINFSEVIKKGPPKKIPTRKSSIDQIQFNNARGTKKAEPEVSTVVATKNSSVSLQATVKPPIEEICKSFKPFAKNLKAHLIHRHNQIVKEGRKGVIADFKKFSADFQIPEALTKKEVASEIKPISPSVSKESEVKEMDDSGSVDRSKLKKIESQTESTPSNTSTIKKTTTVRKPKRSPNGQKGDDTTSVSETESHVTTATAASVSKFKLSVNAPEFTPGAGLAHSPTGSSGAMPPIPAGCIITYLSSYSVRRVLPSRCEWILL